MSLYDKLKGAKVKKIENIFEQDPQFNCFGCGHKNDPGLKLEFFHDEDAEEVFSITTLGNHYVSFSGVVHGGILSTIIDDVAFWTMFYDVKKFALTTKMETEFKQPTRPNTPIEVRGKIEKKDGRIVVVRINVLNEVQQLCASSRVTYFIPKRETILNVLGNIHPSFTEYLD